MIRWSTYTFGYGAFIYIVRIELIFLFVHVTWVYQNEYDGDYFLLGLNFRKKSRVNERTCGDNKAHEFVVGLNWSKKSRIYHVY